jgi:hypothetical protein
LASAPELLSAPPRGAPANLTEWLSGIAPDQTVLRLWAVFSAELVLFAIIRLPLAMSLDAYAFADRGAFPTACYLVTHGRRPMVDFGYIYGLLPMLATQGVFHLFEWAPAAHEAAMYVCGIVSAWGLARFANVIRLSRIGVLFLIAAFPFTILASYPTFVHAMEAAVLCNAIAEQAAGRRSVALALAAAACMVKPAMGYVYGFVLLMLILLDVRSRAGAIISRGAIRATLRSIMPAAVTGAILLSILASVYGVEPLIKTLIPGAASLEYRHMGYGSIFSGGRELWYQPKNFPAFYLFTVAGFWSVATVWLMVAGGLAAYRLARGYWIGKSAGTGEEIVFTCAVLHLLFITCFFGGPVSWEYYSYVLVMGVVASSVCIAGLARALSILVLLAATGQTSHVAMALNAWRTTSLSRATGMLWAPADERKAWTGVMDAASGQDAVALISEGMVSVIFRQFRPPFGAYLVPGVTLKPEMDRATDEIANAPVLFTITSGPLGYALDFFPQLRRELDKRPVVFNAVTRSGAFTVFGMPARSGTSPKRAATRVP